MAQGMTKQHLRIGAGAGFAGDRWEPAVELVERGEIDVIAFECLAERTIARETLVLRRGDGPGYSPKLEARLGAVLPACAAKGIRVVTNMGAAAPLAAGRAACAVAAELGIADFRCAVLLGDDVRDVLVARPELSLLETGEPLESILPRMASANAYLGADAVAEALASGALAVITGRVADPSLFVGPMLHAFGWSYDDYAKLAQATAAGHLLECAGQVTGGYFADPGIKDVPALARLGFPFADVSAAGEVVIGKLAEAGGRVDARTCSEQLLYEIDDPAAYITPDCVLDMGGIGFTEIARDRIRVEGARARPRTPSYKVSVGYFDGYLGAGELSYGGPNAVARARLAGEVVKERLALRGFEFDELRSDLIGLDSLHGPAQGRPEPYEVRLRVAARTNNRAAAEAVGWEVAALYTNGPSGGAGDFADVREILAVQSVLLARELVPSRVEMVSAP
ncbi:MAG: DUF1446 domain-containing protein [Alphaproteobacteria bacterium]|nr:DUF1446 domain-containing protein [Alphaproteobacteria bacterium]